MLKKKKNLAVTKSTIVTSMRLARPMNRAVDTSAFAARDSTATGSIASQVSLGVTSLITVTAMLNAFTIPNPSGIDASAKRSGFSLHSQFHMR